VQSTAPTARRALPPSVPRGAGSPRSPIARRRPRRLCHRHHRRRLSHAGRRAQDRGAAPFLLRGRQARPRPMRRHRRVQGMVRQDGRAGQLRPAG
jgi:hypothetical protein